MEGECTDEAAKRLRKMEPPCEFFLEERGEGEEEDKRDEKRRV